jgi:hypothetical protein
MEDSHKLFNTQADTVCFIMRRLPHILNIDTLRIIYFVHFHMLIKYTIIFWGTSATMHKVFLIKNYNKNYGENRSKDLM